MKFRILLICILMLATKTYASDGVVADTQSPGKTEHSNNLTAFDMDQKSFKPDVVTSALNRLDLFRAALNEAGFDVNKIYLSLTPSPGTTLWISQESQVSDEKKQRILKKYQPHPIIDFTLKALYKSYGIKIKDYSVSSVNITISTIPKVSVVLAKDEDKVYRVL